MRNRVLGAGLLVVACSGSSSPPAVKDPAGFLSQFSTELCQKMLQCCTPADVDVVFNGGLFGPIFPPATPVVDEASCESAVNGGAFGTALVAMSIDGAVTAGTAGFDLDAADSCLAELDGLSCAEFAKARGIAPTSVALTCASPIVPKVALGGTCTAAFECVGSGDCIAAGSGSGSGSGSSASSGTCVAPLAVGDSCADRPCPGTLFCDSAQTCRAMLADGASCASAIQCVSTFCGGIQPDGTGSGTCGQSGICDGDAATGVDELTSCANTQMTNGSSQEASCVDVATGFTESSWQCTCLDNGATTGSCTEPGSDSLEVACNATGNALACCTF